MDHQQITQQLQNHIFLTVHHFLTTSLQEENPKNLICHSGFVNFKKFLKEPAQLKVYTLLVTLFSQEFGPPPYNTTSPEENNQNTNYVPKPQPRSKINDAYPDLPELPSVPTDNVAGGNTKDDIDFDDLTRRFEELKKRK